MRRRRPRESCASRWLACSESLPSTPVKRASTRIIHDAKWNDKGDRLNITWFLVLGGFGEYSPPMGGTEKDRKMILTAKVCKTTVALFGNILQTLLKGQAAGMFRDV
ncbi:hypothetical protein EK21DRAFT_94567 [Setomelanomma holmii]|uniref:Uncharacterized protein n=1 Tax=Setomelanomma holmii TaxID=210430 RepID=A0A9P4LH49_9PLEO|nr:hypothetical protein EK21DRAFT_94567 [Setomelanomma holmii]